MTHILFNPFANNKQGEANARTVTEITGNEGIVFEDITKIENPAEYFSSLPEGDTVILAGGDGTINTLINMLDGKVPETEISYYPTGSGNDFMNDIGNGNKLVPLNGYLRSLPTVTVNGTTKYFLNGIGYGIDGYCCEVGDILRKKSDKPVNYTGIAIKGLLFHFKPANAKITVDGVTREYKKVWLAPTMNGRFYGGGMNVAPSQDRLNVERTVSNVVMYGSGKLKTLIVFPSIFKGEHIKHTEMVEIHTGKDISVEFDRPTALQIDGETVLGVTSYRVKAGITADIK